MPNQPEKAKKSERKFPATPIYDRLVVELGDPRNSMKHQGKHSGSEPSFSHTD